MAITIFTVRSCSLVIAIPTLLHKFSTLPISLILLMVSAWSGARPSDKVAIPVDLSALSLLLKPFQIGFQIYNKCCERQSGPFKKIVIDNPQPRAAGNFSPLWGSWFSFCRQAGTLMSGAQRKQQKLNLNRHCVAKITKHIRTYHTNKSFAVSNAKIWY